MIFVVTLTAVAAATLAHLVGWGWFAHPIAIPVAGVVAMCAMGVMARLIPDRRRGLVAMVPPVLPAREALVWVTGLFELAGGVGVLVPVVRTWAGLGLALLLVAMFPANVRDAHRRGDDDGSFARRILLRGGQQVVFIALCLGVLVGAGTPAWRAGS